MGWKYSVEVWESAIGSDHFYWLQIYGGPSIIKSIYYVLWAKRQGWKCIKFEWRP